MLGEYWRLVRDNDAVFLRGSDPLCWAAHVCAALLRRPILHWIVGNPVAVLRAEQRGYGRLLHTLGLVFAIFEQKMLRLSMSLSRSAVLANGVEVAKIFASSRTTPVVSTSITAADFRVCEDTCGGETIRLVFVGFIRPEKGIEFLIRALPLIVSERPVHLAIVGAAEEFLAEKVRLQAIIDELGLADRVSWEGYAAFGAELFDQIDLADILVLPTLSEGTPRVLVEARARSVPVVSTNVGGIPTSVTDGEDGLLVPPRDPEALAAAISRMLGDGDFRRRLIRTGRERVAQWTVESFADMIATRLGGAAPDDAASGTKS